jgi:hypothetical protein
MIGFAVVLWQARNAEASTARDAIFTGGIILNLVDGIGNIIGLSLGWSVVASAVVLAINILLAVAFFLVGRAHRSLHPNS